jgi:hypothetical protein
MPFRGILRRKSKLPADFTRDCGKSKLSVDFPAERHALPQDNIPRIILRKVSVYFEKSYSHFLKAYHYF